MEYGLTKKDLRIIKEILRKHDAVDRAVIFGSRAMGTFQAGSDLDIALKGVISSSIVSAIRRDLEETTLPYFFDVLDFNTIREPKLIEHIDRYGKVFFVKTERRRRAIPLYP